MKFNKLSIIIAFSLATSYSANAANYIYFFKPDASLSANSGGSNSSGDSNSSGGTNSGNNGSSGGGNPDWPFVTPNSGLTDTNFQNNLNSNQIVNDVAPDPENSTNPCGSNLQILNTVSVANEVLIFAKKKEFGVDNYIGLSFGQSHVDYRMPFNRYLTKIDNTSGYKINNSGGFSLSNLKLNSNGYDRYYIDSGTIVSLLDKAAYDGSDYLMSKKGIYRADYYSGNQVFYKKVAGTGDLDANVLKYSGVDRWNTSAGYMLGVALKKDGSMLMMRYQDFDYSTDSYTGSTTNLVKDSFGMTEKALDAQEDYFIDKNGVIKGWASGISQVYNTGSARFSSFVPKMNPSITADIYAYDASGSVYGLGIGAHGLKPVKIPNPPKGKVLYSMGAVGLMASDGENFYMYRTVDLQVDLPSYDPAYVEPKMNTWTDVTPAICKILAEESPTSGDIQS